MFIKKIILLLIILFSAVSLYNCSDEPSSLGVDLLQNDHVNINEVTSLNDTLSQSSSFMKRTLGLGIATDNLLIGKANNVEASTLIKFFISLPDTIKEAFLNGSITITGAKVQLEKTYEVGEENGTYDLSVHKILSSWGPKFSSDSLSSLTYDANDISSEKLFTDSLNEFNISTDLVSSWFQSAADSLLNEGIYIKPGESSTKVEGFKSPYTRSDLQPFLEVTIEKPGVYIDTLTYIATYGLSVVTGEVPAVDHSSILLQSGLVINGKLRFDISKIPQHSLINNAELILYLDSSETVVTKQSTNTIRAAFIKDSSLFVLDSTSAVTFDSADNYFRATITSYAQRWLADSSSNEGILLFTLNQSSSVDLYTFYGSDALDPALKPRLNIIYTKLK